MTETVAELQTQLIELQTQLAFQEDTLSALDTIVTTQQRQIDQLTLMCERLQQQLNQVAVGGVESTEPELPPHY